MLIGLAGFGKVLALSRQMKGSKGRRRRISRRLSKFSGKPGKNNQTPYKKGLPIMLNSTNKQRPPVLIRRIKKIQNLPPSQQKTLLKTIDTFIKAAEK